MAVTKHTKTSPVGVDVKINSLLDYLHEEITDNYNLSYADFYGRTYPVNKEGVRPYYYQGHGDYVDVLYDDFKQLTMFIEIGDTATIADNATTTIKLVFQVNLEELSSSTTTVDDEEIISYIYSLLDGGIESIDITGLQRNATTVYEGYELDTAKLDVYPFLIFAFEGELNYSMLDIC